MGANLHYKLNSKARIHFSGLREWRRERQTRNAFQNDANINYLSEQLATIGEFGLSSREKIYGKADELKRSIDEKNEKVKSLTAEIPTLKSEISQLHYLFSTMSSTSKPDAMTQITELAAVCPKGRHDVAQHRQTGGAGNRRQVRNTHRGRYFKFGEAAEALTQLYLLNQRCMCF